MSDLSLANMSDVQAPSGAVSLGEASLKSALAEVHKTAHRDEGLLALEGLGLLLGLVLLRRRSV